MNVFCIGYYDKFSRFFIHIEKHLKQKHPDLKFSIASIYISGYLYSKLRNLPSSALTFQAWLLAYKHRKKYHKIISSETHYKGFHIENLISLYKENNSNSIIKQALAYIDILDEKLKDVDILLLIGDLRLPVEIAKTIAEKQKITTYFIEQGPYQTTLFDAQGVNANASIRGYQSTETKNSTEKEDFINHFTNREKKKKYNRSPLYRGLDYFLEALLSKTPILPPDLKINNPLFKYKNQRLASKSFSNYKSTTSKNIFLLICQVPFDVNMTHHSPFYKNHEEILEDVYSHLPENSILVVREHPIYKGKYGTRFYNYILNNKTIFLDTHQDFSKILSTTNVVIVNNSTVGLEAIVQNKTVVALANSYYDSSDICLKLAEKAQLNLLLKKALTYKIDKTSKVNFLYNFFKHHLIEGFITDEYLTAPKTIAEKINSKFID